MVLCSVLVLPVVERVCLVVVAVLCNVELGRRVDDSTVEDPKVDGGIVVVDEIGSIVDCELVDVPILEARI